MRIGDDGRGDHHALELTARALVRVLAVNFLRRGEVHIAQRLERTRAALLLRQLRVDSQRLLDLRADAHERVHRGHRLLKDDAELAALDGAQLRARQTQDIAPVEAHLAGERDLFNARHGLARGAVKADVQIMDLDHGGISFLKISSRRAAGPRRSGSRRGSAAQ